MKYLNVVLSVIAVVLIVISIRIWQVSMLLENLNYSYKLSLNSGQALINSNVQLSEEMVNLRKQVESLGERVLKK